MIEREEYAAYCEEIAQEGGQAPSFESWQMMTRTAEQEPPPLPTYAQISRAISAKMFKDGGGEWAGFPMPIDGLNLVLEPKFPRAAELLKVFNTASQNSSPVMRIGSVENEVQGEVETDRSIHVRNQWHSERVPGAVIHLAEEGGRLKALISFPGGPGQRFSMLLDTMMANKAWDMEREFKAMEKLRGLLTEDQWLRYFLTSTFIEKSPRSNVMYMLRRLRPTLAIVARPRCGLPDDTRKRPVRDGDMELRILAGLCLHSLGYYENTWAGVMTPTDEVISHLCFVRGDEHKFWRYTNQHDPGRMEAGL